MFATCTTVAQLPDRWGLPAEGCNAQSVSFHGISLHLRPPTLLGREFGSYFELRIVRQTRFTSSSKVVVAGAAWLFCALGAADLGAHPIPQRRVPNCGRHCRVAV